MMRDPQHDIVENLSEQPVDHEQGPWGEVEVHRHLRASAGAAARRNDLDATLVLAAASGELLIRHTARMLTFEARGHPLDPDPDALVEGLVSLSSSQLMVDVIDVRLHSASGSPHAVAVRVAWRDALAVPVMRLVRSGRRPNEQTASAALRAAELIEHHIFDRLAARSEVYPRTAYLLVGPTELERRGQLGPTLSRLVPAGDGPRAWLESYARLVASELAQVETDLLDVATGRRPGSLQ